MSSACRLAKNPDFTHVTGNHLYEFPLNHPSELALVADQGNFVHQQNGYGRQRNRGRKRIASEEIQDHGSPARANSDQSAANVRRRHADREVCSKRMP